ncbi:unnamed protein product, partial [marine sediment metagenome]
MRGSAVMIAALVLSTGSLAAAPIETVLDDFEGELSGWPDEVEIVASDDGHGLRWQPSGKEPYFVYFRFGDRGVEISEWDRLEFRYKLSGATVGWWGVKIVDHPLADGLQATYQIPREQVKSDAWQTARIAIHPPQWIWGEQPSETAQTITFRASSVSEGQLTVLLDDIKVVRDRLRLTAEAAGRVETDGPGFARRFDLTVDNRSDEATGVRLSAPGLDEGLSVDLPAGTDVLAGDSVTLTARVHVRP